MSRIIGRCTGRAIMKTSRRPHARCSGKRPRSGEAGDSCHVQRLAMSKPGPQSTGALRSCQCWGRRGSRLGDLCATRARQPDVPVLQVAVQSALVFAYEGHQSGEAFWRGPGRLPRRGRAWIVGRCSGWRLIVRGGERVSHNDCRVALGNTSGRRAYAVSPIPLVTSRIAGSRTCCPLSTLPGKPILVTHHAL